MDDCRGETEIEIEIGKGDWEGAVQYCGGIRKLLEGMDSLRVKVSNVHSLDCGMYEVASRYIYTSLLTGTSDIKLHGHNKLETRKIVLF